MGKLKFEDLRNITRTPQPRRGAELKFEPSSVNSGAGVYSCSRAELVLTLGYDVEILYYSCSSSRDPSCGAGRAALGGKTVYWSCHSTQCMAYGGCLINIYPINK